MVVVLITNGTEFDVPIDRSAVISENEHKFNPKYFSKTSPAATPHTDAGATALLEADPYDYG